MFNREGKRFGTQVTMTEENELLWRSTTKDTNVRK